MKRNDKGFLLPAAVIVSLLVCVPGCRSQIRTFPLNTVDGLTPVHVGMEAVTYQGKEAVRITGESTRGEKLAIVQGTEFTDGILEVELSGRPGENAVAGARGFVGLAFRVSGEDTLRYECFYLRPTNGRAEDQLRRNHTVQYISHPDYPWYRLREEYPGVYESYTDIVPDVWIPVKIVVSGQEARLYVKGAEQPCLIVKDLKHGGSRGAVALWIGPGTVAHFRNLIVRPE